jgi:chromosome segregation ATPase
MDEVNYNDKVILPFLEKKCKDLLSVNMVLEAKLLVEQTKLKDFEQEFSKEAEEVDNLRVVIEQKDQQILNINQQKDQQIAEIHNQMNLNNEEKNRTINTLNDEKNALFREKNDLQGNLNSANEKLQRETSVNQSILGEYHSLKAKFDELNVKLTSVMDENSLLNQDIVTLKTEIETLKSVQPKKSKKELVHGNN